MPLPLLMTAGPPPSPAPLASSARQLSIQICRESRFYTLVSCASTAPQPLHLHICHSRDKGEPGIPIWASTSELHFLSGFSMLSIIPITSQSQFTELIQHTGVGWDGPTNTVKANPDIWDKFIKRHNNFRTFRSKGCKHYEALKLMYKYATTSGAYEFLQPTHLRAPDPMHA
ncbi:hypothetical protein CRG98_021211 [Punica granatum]|uniref:Myb/SANT-like domain-containing protein n=1 Tax=Punica granatum TaxID=22663 RepID=A0A2I0JR57_PUNGR|nr:hypothetical protein CRG98_021211 [Punica granatum]